MVCEKMGIELVELPFTCCPPASSIKQAHYGAWLALAARNLCVAEEAGLNILTLCSGCVNSLKEANAALKENENRRRRVNEILGLVNHHFEGTIEVTHILDTLHEESNLERISKNLVREIPLRLGSHYGCHYFRPGEVMLEMEPDESHGPLPTKLDDLLNVIGAESVEYSRKYLCCGMPLGANVDPDGGYTITREKLTHMRESKLQGLAVICPSCFEQFDLGQVMLSRKYKEKNNMPLFFITQLLGLAMGMAPKALGLDMHRVKAKKLLKTIGVEW